MSTPSPASLLNQAKEHLRAKEAPVEQWKQLCMFLSSLKAPEQASLLKGLEGMLEAFPPAVRTVWPPWLAQQRQGQRIPAMQLARALSWNGPRLDSAGLGELLSHPDFPRLQRLKLFGQDLDSKAILLLVQAPRLRGLESLNLTSNRIDGVGLRALIATGAELSLTQLFLGRNQIQDADARWLQTASLVPSLKLLCLRDNPISDREQSALLVGFESSPLKLRLACESTKPSLPRRKRGRPSKKKPPAT